MSKVDFGRQSDDYGEHRPGFPCSFYDRLERIAPLAKSCGVDLGTGPGIIALEMAKRGAKVTGLDISENQIRVATECASRAGLADTCSFKVGVAEDTKLQDETYDWVTAGQCWHWFDAGKALNEIRRILKPSGLLVIAHFSYLANRSELARQSEELVMKYNPAWDMAGSLSVYPEQIEQVLDANFELVEQFCYDHEQSFSHESWRGRMRTCNGVGSRDIGPDVVEAYDQELKAMLKNDYPETVFVSHRIWTVVARKKLHQERIL